MKSKYLPHVHFSMKAEPAGYTLQDLKYHMAGWEGAALFLFFSETEDLLLGFFLLGGVLSPLLSACTSESCSLLWPVRFMA